MKNARPFAFLTFAILLLTASAAQAQRPYIGFVYPAGGQQGTTFHIRLGGQGLDGIEGAAVSGTGVTARLVEYLRRLNNQESDLVRMQMNQLKREKATDEASLRLIARIERRLTEMVQTPAAASISNLVLVEVTIAADAKPGMREMRLVTKRGISNPLIFCVGQAPEVLRKPMVSATVQVLGKEEQALRARPADEVEQQITLPSTANGQIASREVNRYRFQARKGQRLVFVAQARQLMPFIADAVPGWFQPVMTIYDANGRELAYDDDYRFKPDPVIFFEVPKDGEYLFTINDAIYRGREDFVYRVTVGELPFVTGIFPLGGPAGALPKVQMRGWNLAGAALELPPADARPGVYSVTAIANGMASNPAPFAVDTLPECLEQEPNNDPAHAQKVTLPVIVNGRIQRPDDWDVYRFSGKAGQWIVAEVSARRLDSPLDSVLKLTDASGKVIAVNDDYEDLGSGTNTHNADSYIYAKLPADGEYCLSIGDTARNGGEEYAYRLRISPPQPDFALFTVPTSLAVAGKSSNTIGVQALRKDGFAGPIKLQLKDPPLDVSAVAVTMTGTNTRLTIKAGMLEAKEPLALTIEGTATVDGREITRTAVPAEDRMQAFLWRHLTPATELKLLVYSPIVQPPVKRERRLPVPPALEIKPDVKLLKSAAPKVTTTGTSGKSSATTGKFTRQQVMFRIRQIANLFEEGLLTEEFSNRKISECEVPE